MRNFVLIVLAAIAAIVVACCKPDPPQPPLTKPVVSVGAAINVTATSSTLVASVTPNLDGTIVTFEYKAVTAASWQSVIMSASYGGKTSISVTLNVSDLTPGTEYMYRVNAVNTSGQASSVTSNFTTLVPVIVKPAVAIKAATNVKITEATLVAKVVPNENGTTVSFEYRTLVTSTWTVVAVSGTFAGKDSVVVSLSLSTLVANTDYVYRMKASNVAGETVSLESNFQTYAVKDYDGNYYHSITIGTQTWLKENLKTTHFANGDPIPNVTDATAWTQLTTGAYCWYNNDPEIGKIYGALYNWYVTNDPRGLLIGWHVATDAEWTTMKAYLGNAMNESLDTSGGKLKEAGIAHWKTPNLGATNSSGFTALPGGARQSETGVFDGLTTDNSLWSSTEAPGGYAWGKMIWYNREYLSNDGAGDKQNGLSIRLIKN